MDAHLKNSGFAQLAGGVVSNIAAACFAGGAEAACAGGMASCWAKAALADTSRASRGRKRRIDVLLS